MIDELTFNRLVPCSDIENEQKALAPKSKATHSFLEVSQHYLCAPFFVSVDITPENFEGSQYNCLNENKPDETRLPNRNIPTEISCPSLTLLRHRF